MRIAVVMALLLAGCGPGLSSLVKDRHYREAVCAADDGSATDRETVGRALSTDSALQVHVDALGEAELAPLLGDATADVMARADFVRVQVRTNVLPVDRLDVRVTFTSTAGRAAAAPASWESLAWATGEQLPPRQRVRTYATPGNILRGLGAVITGGVSLLFTRFRAEEVEVDAPPSEFQRAAPRATALRRAMADPRCRETGFPAQGESAGSGRDCAGFYVLERTPGAAWRLEIEQRFIALRAGADELADRDEDRCQVTVDAALSLGPAAELDATTQRVFGDRMRRLTELATPGRAD